MAPRLKDIREEAGISQADLAKAAGMTAGTIRTAETTGAVKPLTKSRIVLALNRIAPDGFKGRTREDLWPDD